MMSKKWAFSLTSLITIIALAFVVSPAMAAFDVTISADDVVQGDALEIEYSSTEQVIKVSFGEVIKPGDFEAADVTVTTINKNGLPALVVPTVANGTPNNGKNFTLTLPSAVGYTAASDTDGTLITKILVQMAAGKVQKFNDSENKNKIASKEILLVRAEPDSDTQADGVQVTDPDVVSITRATPISHTGGGTFVEEVVTGPFQVKIVLTEKPHGGLADGDAAKRIAALDVAEGTVTSVVAGVPFARHPVAITSAALTPSPSEGGYDSTATTASPGTGNGPVPDPSGRDRMYYPYLASITPKGTADMVTIKVKGFKDTVKPQRVGSDTEVLPGEYVTPTDSVLDTQPNGRDRLKVKVVKDPAAEKAAGQVVTLAKNRVIPAGGYLIVATDPGSTGINLPDEHDKEDNTPKKDKRTPAELKYNVTQAGLRDLEAFLINGGTIDLVAPAAGLMISEIMWGSDASLDPNNNSQWIEIKNTTAGDLKTGDGKTQLIFYGPNENLLDRSVAANNIQDRVGTIDDNGRYWSVTGIGQSGRSGHGETKADLTAVVPTLELISMYRVTGTAATGNTQAAWKQSPKPAVNIVGANRVGSPGDENHEFTPPLVEKPDPPTPPTIPTAEADDIMITEVMVDTGNGRLPQWIELTSSATGEVSLEGWDMVIDNAIDDDVLGGGNAITVNLSGVLDVSAHTGNTGKGQSLLVVAWTGASVRASDNIRADRVINLAKQLGQTRRYQLLSYNGFRITLVPPDQGAIAAFGDIAGNLDEDWELPMDGRSSLIRREMLADGTDMLGTDANGWVLASSTTLITGQQSYYGDDEDAGTPGQDSGGPLPVELSHFRPARDKATGAVVITWATQSELNNAGFFIKRSQQRNGQFKVINATMIAGAGTTSEKQFYTYTDTTAQPNVVYYYQIEDVSLDGNRQTLTRGIRLKGHIGAAGKLTSTWGELKSSNE